MYHATKKCKADQSKSVLAPAGTTYTLYPGSAWRVQFRMGPGARGVWDVRVIL